MPHRIPILLLLALVSAHSASAVDELFVTVVNTTGVAASDLHVTFAGAGGNVRVSPLAVIAPGCPVPAVPSNPPTVTSEVVIDWGAACVPPGGTVSFLVRTINGPLSVVSGFWSPAGGGSIGPIVGPVLTPVPPRPPGGLSAIKVVGFYRVLGTPTWTLRHLGQDDYCLRCDIPGAECWYRVFYCPFANRRGRFFEIPPWLPLTPWLRGPDIPPKSVYRHIVYWLTGRVVGPPPWNPPNGPSGGVPWGPWLFTLDARYSDDGDENFRQAADLTSTFYNADAALEVPAPPVMPATHDELEALFGPLYMQASQKFFPLVVELDQVLAFEPDPQLQTFRNNVQTARISLQQIGSQLTTANVVNPTPFFAAANAFGQMAANIPILGQSPRYLDTSQDFNAISAHLDMAGQMVLAGLDDEMEQIDFRDAMFNRIPLLMHRVAGGTMPHMRVQLDLGDYLWSGAVVQGVYARIQNATTDEIADDYILPISYEDQIDIPLMHLLGQPLRIEMKLPTHLSRVIDVAAQDGGLLGPVIFKQGDADGNNCVDLQDLQMVMLDQGMGGPFSGFNPSTDVNGDGQVDVLDVDVVSLNLGHCGERLPCPGDVDGDQDVDLTDLARLLAHFGQPNGATRGDGDLDGDGDVDLTDLSKLLARYGGGCA